MILENQLVFITGAGQGNGAAMAKGMARYGARLIVSDVNAETAAATAQAIKDEGGEAWSFRLDVTDNDACIALAERIQADIGYVDTIINNAGYIDRQHIDSPTLRDAWSKCMSINLDGSLNVSLAFLPHLRATKGSLINISSIGAVVSTKSSIAYSSSKAAVSMMTKDLAQELAPEGVRVNAIAPGSMKTPMTEVSRSNPERANMFLASIPMGRFGEPEELVGAASFLACSKMSSYVTGTIIGVDGGYLTT